jgi:hypothetical protein
LIYEQGAVPTRQGNNSSDSASNRVMPVTHQTGRTTLYIERARYHAALVAARKNSCQGFKAKIVRG